MRKRQKMIIAVAGLTVFFGALYQFDLDIRYWLISGLGLVTWLAVAWALKEGLMGWEWLTVTLPSTLFSIAAGLFYILLPQSWLAKIFVLAFFAVIHYILLLTGNIFSVAAIRTIALLRAAHAVGFVATLFTGFLLFNSIMSFRLPFWGQGIAILVTSAILLVPSLWSIRLEERPAKDTMAYSVGIAFILGLFATAVAFLPVSIIVGSLFLSTMLYVFLGLTQHHFDQRLFTYTIREYIVVGGVVLITMLFTLGWGR